MNPIDFTLDGATIALGLTIVIGVGLIIAAFVTLFKTASILWPLSLFSTGIILVSWVPVCMETFGLKFDPYDHYVKETFHNIEIYLLILMTLAMLLDTLFAALPDFDASTPVPTYHAGTGFQVRPFVLGIIATLVLGTWSAIAAHYQTRMNPDFVTISEITTGKKGLTCGVNPHFALTMDADQIAQTDLDIWKQEIQTQMGMDESLLHIERIISVKTVSLNGKTITEYVVRFDGWVKKDGAPGRPAVAPVPATAKAPAVPGFPEVPAGFEPLENRTKVIPVLSGTAAKQITAEWAELVKHEYGPQATTAPTGGFNFSGWKGRKVAAPKPNPFGI